MLFPRLLAVAERAWHEADWQSADTTSAMRSGRTHDWEQFANTVGYKELRTLEQRGIHYRLSLPGVRYCEHCGANNLSLASSSNIDGLPQAM